MDRAGEKRCLLGNNDQQDTVLPPLMRDRRPTARTTDAMSKV